MGKTARVASKLSKNNDVTGLIGKDRDEAELRNKLVSNLKEKEIKKMKECGDKIRNDKLYSDGDESREEISEEEEDNISGSPRDKDERRDRDERRHRLAVAKERKVEKLYSSEEEGDLDQLSEEDLRLTSSTDNDEEGNGTEDKKKKRKKEKKKKKKKETPQRIGILHFFGTKNR